MCNLIWTIGEKSVKLWYIKEIQKKSFLDEIKVYFFTHHFKNFGEITKKIVRDGPDIRATNVRLHPVISRFRAVNISEYTVFPRSSDPFYKVAYFMKRFMTSLTYSMYTLYYSYTLAIRWQYYYLESYI